MGMNALKKKRKKIAGKIRRRQSWRQKARKLQKHVGKKIGKRLDGFINSVTRQLKDLHKDLQSVERQIEQLEQKAKEGRDATLKWELAQVGKSEDTEWHKKITASMGVPADWAWCSTFQGYALIHFGGFKPEELPPGVPYSGSWLSWKHGTRVSYADRQPGDLLVFDWGDGGMTDHVAMYAGDGLKIGGNENDRVEHDAVPTQFIVGVVRPNWNRNK